MIITRTPFRISFFGGGTDYPVWFEENGGAVLGTTIDKYCYITCRYLPPFFDHKSRVVYSQVETVQENGEIRHPAVRGALDLMNITAGIEIHHDGDLPARAGLGSSSSFAVGLLHALYALKGTMPDKRTLAMDAIHLEQRVLAENVGCQDQVLAAYGGFNLIEFGGAETARVRPVTVSPARIAALQQHLLLFFTGTVRDASDVAADQIRETPNRKSELTAMLGLVREGLAVLNSSGDLLEFGRLLDQSWRLKRRLSSRISTDVVDEIYSAGLDAGAIGGKLLGAGGGGFMLFFAPPQAHAAIRSRLANLIHVPFEFEHSGTQMIFYQPQVTADTAALAAPYGLEG